MKKKLMPLECCGSVRYIVLTRYRVNWLQVGLTSTLPAAKLYRRSQHSYKMQHMIVHNYIPPIEKFFHLLWSAAAPSVWWSNYSGSSDNHNNYVCMYVVSKHASGSCYACRVQCTSFKCSLSSSSTPESSLYDFSTLTQPSLSYDGKEKDITRA